MSIARAHALVLGAVWLSISVAFVFIFLDLGIDALASPSGEQARSLIRSVILPGYIVSFAIVWRSRRARRAGNIDERDQVVERRATELTAIVTLLAVFLFSIGLYDANVEAGAVPVGWLYVLAYGSIALVSTLHPIATLILDYTWHPNG